MRLLIFLLCWSVGAWGADYYVRPACANNGDGTAETCAASGGSAGAYNVMSSITSTADGQVELTRGNTVYLIGTSAAAWNPGGVAAGDGTPFVLRGDHELGAGGFAGSQTTWISISGTNRRNITLLNLSFSGATGTCISIGTANDITVDGITIPAGGCGTHGVAMVADGTTIEIKNSTFGYVGPAENNTGGMVYAAPATGTTVAGLLIHDNVFVGDNGFGRYGVGLYPPDDGTITGAEVYDNAFTGSYSYMPITVQNDVDGAKVYDNTISVTAAQGGIHIGGQGTIGACPVTTDNALVYGNSVTGTAATTQGTGDDSGIGLYADECSVGTQMYRNQSYGNAIAGLYLNDSATGDFYSNLLWGNGSNCINVHGISDGNAFEHNTCDNTGATFGGGAGQGRDAVQQDNTAGNSTANIFRNNVIIGDAAKCFDVDGDPGYVSESFNLIYGCPTLVEGFTQTGGLNADPLLAGGSAPTTAAGHRPAANSPLCGAGTYIAGARDFDDLPMGYPADIGAYRCDRPGQSVDLGDWSTLFSGLMGLAVLMGGSMLFRPWREAT